MRVVCSMSTVYKHHGKPICRNFYVKLHGIGHHKLDCSVAHLKKNGLLIWQKNWSRRKSNTRSINVLSTKIVLYQNFAEAHAIKFLGWVPGSKAYNIYISYHQRRLRVLSTLGVSSSVRTVVGFTTFSNLWHPLLPFVISSRPATYLGWVSQLNNTLINEWVYSKWQCNQQLTYLIDEEQQVREPAPWFHLFTIT